MSVLLRKKMPNRPFETIAGFAAPWAVMAIFGFWFAAPVARACTTPVYRYAMYNWGSSPFVVCYLHRGEPDAQDEPVHQKLREASRSESAAANVVLEPIDLDQWKPEKLPPPVREVLQAHADGPLPTHVVLTPWGAELSAGRLDASAIASLIDSPMRKQLGGLLEQGNAAVLLWVPGKAEAENKRVEEAIKKTIAEAAAGNIPVASIDPGMPPMQGPGTEEAAEDAIAAANRLELATVKLDRTDKAEKWLVDSLMKIEPDLHEYVDEPMVFAVYGRGRSMEPYIGKGITVDNLCQLVAFLAGACSCMVKEQNPGVDLLFQWDWEATADQMAANDPTLNPMGFDYQEMPVDPAGDPVDIAEDTGTAKEAKSQDPAAEQALAAKPVETESALAAQPATAVVEEANAVAAPVTEEGSVQPIAATTARSESESLAKRQMWTLGAGAIVAAIAVLAAGFVVFRRRLEE